MAGQSAALTLSAVHSAIASIKQNGGISEMETSAIGGSARNGSDAHGENVCPTPKNVAEEFKSKMGGRATTGMTGPNSGYGRTT
jgi:hypothetical protein